jgi:CHAD domain-containing protein
MDLTRISVTAAQPTVEVAALMLKELLAEVMQLFQLAAERGPDDVEFVHQLRVSTRRAAAGLRLFEDYLPRRATRRLRRRLSKLRKRAGLARDVDVFEARLSSAANGHLGKSVHDQLDAMRTKALGDLRSLYEKWDRGERLEPHAIAVISAIRPRRSAAARDDTSFGEFAPRCLRRLTKRFFHKGEIHPTTLPALHAFRIRAKQLRYCLELLRPGLDEQRFDGCHLLVKKLAQRLGDVNDHASAESIGKLLRPNLGAGGIPTADGSQELPADALEQFVTAEQRALEASRAEFVAWWSPRRRRRFRRRLKKMSEHHAVIEVGTNDEGGRMKAEG